MAGGQGGEGVELAGLGVLWLGGWKRKAKVSKVCQASGWGQGHRMRPVEREQGVGGEPDLGGRVLRIQVMTG